MRAHFVVQLGWKGASANAGCIGLNDADHAVDGVWRNAGARRCAACACVGRGDEGVGAEVDVEHHALCSFEEDFVVVLDGFVEQGNGVADERAEIVGRFFDLNEQRVDIERFRAHANQHLVLGFGLDPDPVEEVVFKNIAEAQAGAVHLVAVSRADATLGGADLLAVAELAFLRAVKLLVVLQDDVRAVGDEQAVAEVDPALGQILQLVHQADDIDHQAVADHAFAVFAQDTRRREVEHIFLVADLHGVAGVVAALVAHHPVHVRGEYVDNLAFTFVAPLRPDQYCLGHVYGFSG